MEKNIFISHRHDDQQIASALRKQLLTWGIPEKCIFQSSAKGGPRFGEPIKDEIKSFLSKANLVILIYTFSDENWDFPMWECGLAVQPDTDKTRIVVFQFANDTPKVFTDELLIQITEKDIEKFTKQFHKDKDFFPDLDAHEPEISGDGLKLKAKNLFDSLDEVRPLGKYQKKVRWGYFKLELPSEITQNLKDLKTRKEVLESFDNLQKQIYVSQAEAWGVKHFGFEEITQDLTLNQLVERWEQCIQEKEEEEEGQKNILDKTWLAEFQLEIWRSSRNASPVLSWKSLKSAYPDVDWLVCPIINEARFLPDGSLHLIAYMYKVAETLDDPAGKEVT